MCTVLWRSIVELLIPRSREDLLNYYYVYLPYVVLVCNFSCCADVAPPPKVSLRETINGDV